MSNNMTVARPYAKALFEIAVHDHQLQVCSSALNALSIAVMTPVVKRFLQNPGVDRHLHTQLLCSVIKDLPLQEFSVALENFVRLLAENKRLLCIPSIFREFEQLRADYEKTLDVLVKTFAPLTTTQQQDLCARLSKRLQRKVSIHICVDETLLGGAVIYADDLVIDDSVKTKLMKLQTSLAA